MKYWKRWRYWAVLALPVLVILISCIGPSGWREPFVRLQYISWTAIAVALAHSARKALFDYAQGRAAYLKAMEHPVGAGLVFLGLTILGTGTTIAFVYAIFSGIATAQTVPQPVPKGAYDLAPIVNSQLDEYWPAIARRSYVGSLIEKETCITLTHKTCWSTLARLKTAREEGAGLGQITRAYDGNGKLRFDALAETRDLDPTGLKELSWQTVYVRADLNIRAILVKLKHCDTYMIKVGLDDGFNRLAFCDAAYNGGLGGITQDRKLCYLTEGCDPNQWFDHVENHSTKSRVKWQGYGQSAYDINRAHVRATVPLYPRRIRYIDLFGV